MNYSMNYSFGMSLDIRKSNKLIRWFKMIVVRLLINQIAGFFTFFVTEILQL